MATYKLRREFTPLNLTSKGIINPPPPPILKHWFGPTLEAMIMGMCKCPTPGVKV